eukprot:gene39804-55599_t
MAWSIAGYPSPAPTAAGPPHALNPDAAAWRPPLTLNPQTYRTEKRWQRHDAVLRAVQLGWKPTCVDITGGGDTVPKFKINGNGCPERTQAYGPCKGYVEKKLGSDIADLMRAWAGVQRTQTRNRARTLSPP